MKDVIRRGSKNRSHDESPMVQSLVPYHFTPFISDEFDDLTHEYLRSYWQAIRRNIWLIAGITLFATLAVAVYEIRLPDQYEAQARVEIGRESPAPGLKDAASNGAGSTEDSVYFNTQLQILTSSALLRRVVKTLDLEHEETFLHPSQAVQHSPWQRLVHGGAIVGPGGDKDDVLLTKPGPTASIRDDLNDAKKLEPYVNALSNGLKAEPIKETRTEIKETRLIDISFSHSVPQIAAKVVNAVADSAATMNIERKSETSAIASEFLQKRIAELQSLVRREEEELLAYAAQNQIVSLDASKNTVVERLAGLNRELLDAENERRKAEAAYQAAVAPNGAETMALENTIQNTPEQSKLAELRQRRVQLLVENTEEWPEVKEIDKQIVEVERQIKDGRATAAANIRKSLEARYRQALAREQSLRDAFNEQQGATIAQNQAGINYNIKQQEIETNKGILQSLLQHSKENDIAHAGLSNSVHVIDYATVPAQPVGPKRLRNVGLAFIMSLGLAMGWVLVRESFDDTIRSINDVEKKLHVPALSVVPPARAALNSIFSTVRPLPLAGDALENHPELLLGDADPVLAEVYRQLRASLLLSRDGFDLKSMLVTSSLPSEGKTTTAINTAISFAESGANVLLIDGDLRRPSLHRILDVTNDHGLSSALRNGLEGSELLALVKNTEVRGLSLLPSGPQMNDSAILLDHEKLRPIIATLESNFTHIVIDSPPIVPFADSVILGAEVDGVLMVVQGGKSPQEIVLRSMKLLDDVDAVILGVVLNNTKLQPIDTYYQSYCRQYYHGSDAKAAALPRESSQSSNSDS
ncbi:MAG TPA: polysaccharide biosynthesis tyrosine autokinase [Pyrinomonadaceae bacterium]|nr:polysaccharide biosynthesis tyrosine autokinase [Pyrinomonadaceae bacterium]